MRPTLPLLMLALVVAPIARARTLDWPVHRPGEAFAGPCYSSERLEIQLAPTASRAARARFAGPTRAGEVLRLGVPGPDAVAAALGATFEPEFVGETAPEPGAPDFTSYYTVHLPEGSDLSSALDQFAAAPGVVRASPVGMLPVAAIPNDSLFASQRYLSPDAPRHDIHAIEAWNTTRGDSAVIVAVLDTGVLPYHPDLGTLSRATPGNLYINWREANGLPGVDDDGNGFVDDVWGWDFVNLNPATDPWANGEDGRFADPDPNDYSGHGTAVAGVVGAITDNVSGLAGVSPLVRIMPLRVAYLPQGSGQPGGVVLMDLVAQAVRYATRMGASVLNCSFASLTLPSLVAAVDAATKAGVTMVVASGNNGQPAYLGTRDDVISVAATDSLDIVQTSSVLGTWVDLCADGVDVPTLYVRRAGVDSIGSRQPGYHPGLSGTSFSAPQVSGVAALMQARRLAQGLKPLSPYEVMLRLRETTQDISALQLAGLEGFYGTGRLDAERALTDPPTSTATRAMSRTSGPAAVLTYNTGTTRVVYATFDRHLVALDGVIADTLWSVALPGAPVGNVAAADFGSGIGIGIFVGTTNGKVVAVRDDGSPYPVAFGGPGASTSIVGGMAIGDVDGDGFPDVVCAAFDGKVWAWNAVGGVLGGFPFDTGTFGPTAPAIVDLDGVPGAEIVVIGGDGVLHVVTHDGTELGGSPWTAPVGWRAPIAVRLGGPAAPVSIVVASNGEVDALAADGTVRWTYPYTGSVVADPIAADLDGDGAPEIVFASSAPSALTALDSLGHSVSRGAFPIALPSLPTGALVAGPLGAGARLAIGFATSAGFVARDDSGFVVPGWPRPGGAGLAPSLADLDGDGRTEVAAGTPAVDSVAIFAYDAGPATWNAARAQWPTPRADVRRTGAYSGSAPSVIDRVRPGPVLDLAAALAGLRAVDLTWTSPGDDSLTGRAALVDVYYAAFAIDEGNLASAFRVGGLPAAPGTLEHRAIVGLDEGRTYWFAVRVTDGAGNRSALSNVASITIPGLAPARIADLRITTRADSLVTLAWTATGDDGTVGRPRTYTIAASPAAIDSANVDAAPVQLTRDATVDAGGTESATVPGLARGARWSFAVRATDASGTRSDLSNVVRVTIPMGGAIRGRTGVLVAARPQPSGVPVAIDWQGASEAVGGAQSLTILDLTGRLLKRVALGGSPGGTYHWDGRDAANRRVPAGLYFVRLVSGSHHAQARIVLVP